MIHDERHTRGDEDQASCRESPRGESVACDIEYRGVLHANDVLAASDDRVEVRHVVDELSHNMHSSSTPRRDARPSAVVTHGRSCHGGSCLTCCEWPHWSSATHCPSSSWGYPTIACFMRTLGAHAATNDQTARTQRGASAGGPVPVSSADSNVRSKRPVARSRNS